MLDILKCRVCCPDVTVKYSDVAPGPSVVSTEPSHNTEYVWLVPVLFINRTRDVELASHLRVWQYVPVYSDVQ